MRTNQQQSSPRRLGIADALRVIRERNDWRKVVIHTKPQPHGMKYTIDTGRPNGKVLIIHFYPEQALPSPPTTATATHRSDTPPPDGDVHNIGDIIQRIRSALIRGALARGG